MAPDPDLGPFQGRTMASTPFLDRLTGIGLAVTTALAAAAEWTGAPALWLLAEIAALAVLLLLWPAVGWGRRVFVVVGAALALAALALLPDGAAAVGRALHAAAFIAAFFTALASLRHASAGSAAIARAGRFLAEQPPGRRYGALTLGGQLFALPLNYGALVLLGTLAEANARAEPDPEIRGHRLRRMLLAVQRGFVSTLPWSPVAFAMAISLSVVPGASWAAAVGPCLVSGVILAGLGWGLDTVFKPRLSRPPPPRGPVEGGWGLLWPLGLLLALLAAAVGGLHLASGVRVVGVAMLAVPMLALGWVALQEHGASLAVLRRAGRFALAELPDYRGEIVLLMMAGSIGSLGGALAVPGLAAAGLDLSALPAAAILIGVVWLIPLAGQAGMNPILTVSLIGPMLPEPAALGVAPGAVILALTAGWALSGASSPFTATTLLIGAMGGVSAWRVGLGWNGLYTGLGAALLSGWVWLWVLSGA